jgi:hypothetical protein
MNPGTVLTDRNGEEILVSEVWIELSSGKIQEK